jgi:hypothetical protein
MQNDNINIKFSNLVDAIYEAITFAEQITDEYPDGFGPSFTWIWGYVSKLFEEPIDSNLLLSALSFLVNTGKLKSQTLPQAQYNTYRHPYLNEETSIRRFDTHVFILKPHQDNNEINN